MDPTISLSKGCFAFKTSGKKQRKSTSKVNASNKLWYQKYEKLKIQSLKKQDDFYNLIYGPLFEEVLQFVKKSGEDFVKGSVTRVPAAIIHTGMALADYVKIFSVLTTKLRNCATPHVAVLKGKECPSLKVAVESLVQQFTSVVQSKSKVTRNRKRIEEIESDSDTESESSGDEAVLVKSLKRTNLNFPSLSEWYNSLSDKLTDKSKILSDASKKPLVVFVSDVEGFSPSILQDLIYISKNYVGELPLVLLFSVATSSSLVTRYISEHALSCLSYKFIQSPSTSNVLSDLVKAIIISQDSLFLLGGKILNIFMNTFNYLDNSLSGFMRMYQFCLMEHFYAEPLKSLCCPLTELKGVVKDFSTSNLEELRQLPSFRKFVECRPPKERAPLLLDDSHLKKLIPKLMADLHARIWELHSAVNVLNIISKCLPGSPFGCELHETYIQTTSKNIFSDFDEAVKLLKLLSRDDFLKIFTKVLEVLEDSVKSCPGTGSVIEETLDKMKQNLDEIAERDQENRESLVPQTKCSPHKCSERVLKDSLTKNACSPPKNGDSIMVECSVVLDKVKSNGDVSPLQSPGKKVSSGVLSGLHDTPTKRACIQLRSESAAGSPSVENHTKSSVSGSPVRQSQEKTAKTPNDGFCKISHDCIEDMSKDTDVDLDLSLGKIDRSQLRQRLLLLSKQNREAVAQKEAKWEGLKENVLENFRKALVLSLGDGHRPFITFPLYELLVFENIRAVRHHLIPPSPQAALHSVLVNPKQYLECDCCELPELSSILPSLPDVCIAYKLHLECGRMINLYDWLQAFTTIVSGDEDDGKEVQVDVKMQARFMQAVAELQFMGFIKATKRKADHVVRLTWGGLT